jgi:uncharacterized protein (TIGR03435 family)
MIRVAGLMLMAGLAYAQAPPSFEVASIKSSNSADRRPMYHVSGGRFAAANVTVKSLIETAYGIKDFQISGGPGWMGSDLFDINAEAESPVHMDQFATMLQSLLAERFHLIVRRETRQMPVYALVVAKTGPKVKGADQSAPPVFKIRRGLLVAPKASTAELAFQLSNFLGQSVLDKTQLTGKYNLRLEWVPDENQVAMFSAMGVPEGNGAPAADWPGPSLFTAIEEQLGLKLESQKGPVEILTVERIEKPSEN